MNRGCLKLIIVFSTIVFILSSYYYLIVLPRLRHEILLNSLETIRDSIEAYNNDYPKSPLHENSALSTSKLLGNNGRRKVYLNANDAIIKSGIIYDYWDNPIQITKTGEKLTVFSYGKNNKPNDEDDIMPP
jgi:hypothetical protein